MKDSFVKRLSSRKFLLALLAAIIAFGNYYFGWGLKMEEVGQIILPLLAFIGIEGANDAIRTFKE